MPPTSPARPVRSQSGTPGSRLGRARRRAGSLGNSRPRLAIGRIVMVLALVAAGLRLVDVQGVQATALSAKAERQLQTPIVLPAERGVITDRNGNVLAFSVDIKALYAQPATMRKNWSKTATVYKQYKTFDEYTQAIADLMATLLGNQINEQTVLNQLRSNAKFVYLDQQVEPSIAAQITGKFTEIGAEDRSQRQYPADDVAANVVGVATWQYGTSTTPSGVHGLTGLEYSMNSQLAGHAGSETVDTEQGNTGVVIPGSQRNEIPAVAGENVQLTIDSDVQYQVQQMLQEYVTKTGAKDGTAVVLDAHTGQVYALAQNNTFNPNQLAGATAAQIGDQAVTTPYEPGSVGKIVTMAAAMNAGLITPTTQISVPQSIQAPGWSISDDWRHGLLNMTVTGILAKSSNVGTLKIAQMVGPTAFYNMLMKMGLGSPTGVGLPGESGGYVPPMNKWSGSTFYNLPFGQGYSVTILQMASMYQAIANGGVRVPPRIIASVTQPDGTVVKTQQPAGVRVVSQQAAAELLQTLRYVEQNGPGPNSGTGVLAALPGYQVAGKTGTAQQIDPATGRYSGTAATTTFAGILSAPDPRFVIGVMLDDPANGQESAETAAPLFHDIAAYLATKYNLPATSETLPYQTFVEP